MIDALTWTGILFSVLAVVFSVAAAEGAIGSRRRGYGRASWGAVAVAVLSFLAAAWVGVL